MRNGEWLLFSIPTDFRATLLFEIATMAVHSAFRRCSRHGGRTHPPLFPRTQSLPSSGQNGMTFDSLREFTSQMLPGFEFKKAASKVA
jgi:hypothetical protein